MGKGGYRARSDCFGAIRARPLFYSVTLSSISRKLRRALAALLPHNNARCVAPPGKIRPGVGRPVLVASLPRSGTHLLIDLLLNNFPACKREPLYVDLYHYLAQGGTVDELKRGGCHVIKAHFPDARYPESAVSALKELAAHAFIIQPARREEDVRRSQTALGFRSAGDFPRAVEAFESFWRDYPRLQVPFADIIDPIRCPAVIDDIGRFIGQKPVTPKILPPAKNATVQVLVMKALTRLLGSRSPWINTTIGFALTKKER